MIVKAGGFVFDKNDFKSAHYGYRKAALVSPHYYVEVVFKDDEVLSTVCKSETDAKARFEEIAAVMVGYEYRGTNCGNDHEEDEVNSRVWKMKGQWGITTNYPERDYTFSTRLICPLCYEINTDEYDDSVDEYSEFIIEGSGNLICSNCLQVYEQVVEVNDNMVETEVVCEQE
jgi:hypothetical protein